LENIVYANPKGNSGKKFIKIGYKDPEKDKILPLLFQTSDLYCGCSVKKNKDSNVYQLDVPIYAKSKEKTLEFKNFLMNINDKIIKGARKYEKKWFNNVNELKYKSIIRSSPDDKNEFRNGIIKLRFNNNELKTYVFD
jgi:hypothetical protein